MASREPHEERCMSWSTRIGTFAGIKVYVHFTFTLFVGWLLLAHWQQGHSLATTLAGVGFVLALFLCVLLHEFGHATIAKKYGIHTKDITLLPIGGVARLERMPEDPRQEFFVAVAGPAINTIIAGVLFAILVIGSRLEPLSQITITTGPFLERLMLANIALVLFNLLPAFPMDGGRILRAALASRMQHARATQVAGTVGQAMAFLFAAAGLFFGHLMLVLIAVFVWIGASQETGAAQAKFLLNDVPVSRAMMTDFQVLDIGDRARRAVDLTIQGAQQDFPVLENGRVVGFVTRQTLLRALAQAGENAPVNTIMTREFEEIAPAELLSVALERLTTNHVAAVVDEKGRLLGVLTLENLSEYLMIKTSLASQPVSRAA